MQEGANEGDPAAVEDAAAGDDVPLEQGLSNRYEIRILTDGRVVFGDLPQGLWEVAQIVAGSDCEPQSVAAESEQDHE